jgi:hypothetical protein
MPADYGSQSVKFSGTTTEFDDILIARGIITKEQALVAQGMDLDSVAEILVNDKLQELGFFDQPEETQQTKAEAAALASLKELDELDEDGGYSDESCLGAFREKRLAELKAKRSTERYGSVKEITKPEWIKEVNDASAACWVICHLYADHIDGCEVMDSVISRFAARFRSVKCLRIKARNAVENFPDSKLPALFFYRNGSMQHQLITLAPLFGLQTRDVDLEWYCAVLQVVESELEEMPAPPPPAQAVRRDPTAALAQAEAAAERDRVRNFVRRREAPCSLFAAGAAGEVEEDVDEYADYGRSR